MNMVRIAVAPTRRGISSNRKGAFLPEDAVRIKEQVLSHIEKIKGAGVEIVNIDWLNSEGIMYDVSHADVVAAKLSKLDIDALFIVHANFGCEEAAGRLAHLLKKPVLLWGPRDEMIGGDGSRSTDTQCGLFASSRLMLRYGVPFTYIENCRLTDKAFEEGFEKFIGVASTVKAFKNMRVGMLNARPKYFTSVMFNESELLEKFGIEIVPVNIAQVQQKMRAIEKERAAEVGALTQTFHSCMECSATDPHVVGKNAALQLAVQELAAEHGLSAMAAECWTLLPAAEGVLPCLTIANLSDKGLPMACEGDIHGAITSVLLQAASRGRVPFFGEFTMRHPQNDNAELVWHCGPYPLSLKKPDVKAVFANGRPGWEICGGNVTLARFDGDRGKYSLFAGQGRGVDGPYTSGTYLWFEVPDWVKWEKKLIYGPYIHHISGVHGKLCDILRESCRYIGGLAFDTVE